MGLIGGIARTAVVAGTATAVSNRVSRRQAGRWASQYEQEQDAAAYRQQAYAPPPAAAPQAAAPRATAPPPVAAPATDDVIAKLERLAELRSQGVLSEAEFQAQKARVLGA
jgi:hypothetical protein